MKCAAWIPLLLLLSGATPLVADPEWYVRGGTWHESLIRSRESLLRREEAESIRSGTSSRARWSPWQSLGPFPPGDRIAELEPRLRTGDELASAAGDVDRQQRWVAHAEYLDGFVHSLFTGEHVVYLRRTIVATTAVTTTVYFDTLGAMTLWLNGEPCASSAAGHIAYNLWDGDVHLKATPVTLKLRAGDNQLLAKIELHPRLRPRDDSDPWRKDTLEARRPWGTVFTGYSNVTGPAVEYEARVYGEVSHFYFSTAEIAGPVVDAARRNRELLWDLLARDFTDESAVWEMDWERKLGIWTCDWRAGDDGELARRYAGIIRSEDLAEPARQLAERVTDLESLSEVRNLAYRYRAGQRGVQCLRDAEQRKTLGHQIESLRLAVTDLMRAHGQAYPYGDNFLVRLSAIEKTYQRAIAGQSAESFSQAWDALEKLRREALLANPLLDFDQLLVVKRRANPFVPDLPFNWANNSSLTADNFENEIAVLSPRASGNRMATLYRPDGRRFVGDLDLHFNADRLLFSMPGSHGRWQVFEIRTDGSGLRQVTQDDLNDVDRFDACYLPNGKIMFCSTASFAGVPCVHGRDAVGVLFVMDADGQHVRQVGFDQDQDFHPTVLNDGRILYTRWEYADVPHFFSRLLFSANPDGTDQKSLYGSNSYWPNGIFYARPVPGNAGLIIGVVSGHHGIRRSGELVLFDPSKSQWETAGVVQRIPGRGQRVEPVINDRLVTGSWPKFLHPFPLSDKYFLVSCRMNEDARWSIYLVDVFDNMLPLYDDVDHDLLEPIPLRRQARPPVIPDRVNHERKDAIVNLVDVYAGPGLAGVPRGTVKRLRVIAYHYAYQNLADDSRAIGVDASWDTVKRVLGTVPVQEDGSALFRIPANTPITLQPLDAQGRAVQLMRSWLTAMPGETVSCVGCHAPSSVSPPAGPSLAVQLGPSAISPWYGPTRGFSFEREVQPVLQKYCVGCHNGSSGPDGRELIDLRQRKGSDPRGFSPSYLELQRFVTRPGAESDYHLLPAAEYHAGVSELVQLLEKGHHHVELDTEAWDRLVTWIDLNVPFFGTWHEAQGADRVGDQRLRRRQLQQPYAGLDEDPEQIIPVDSASIQPVVPATIAGEPVPSECIAGWPWTAGEARRRQQSTRSALQRTVDLGSGVVMHFVTVPAGEFMMGDPEGSLDERPRPAQIAEPFWIGQFEVTNQQFARFDPSHDSRYIRTHGITSTRGYAVNLPEQPVVRVSWDRADAFCRWLSARTGESFTLPTEEMWEYACRAGTATALSYGDTATDFSRFANLADKQVEHLRDYSHNSPIGWFPRDGRYDDTYMVTAPIGRFQPNVWGVYDMHGNAAEWTRSDFGGGPAEARVVRGGSFRDRPDRGRSAARRGYPSWQRVHDVGFRVVWETSADSSTQRSPRD